VIEQVPLADQALQEGTVVRVVATPAAAGSAGAVRLRYEVPSGNDRVQLRMVARDESGEHEIFRGERNGGDAVEVPVPGAGPTRVRIFLNDLLVDERIVEGAPPPGAPPS
jgi:hypothetical protein